MVNGLSKIELWRNRSYTLLETVLSYLILVEIKKKQNFKMPQFYYVPWSCNDENWDWRWSCASHSIPSWSPTAHKHDTQPNSQPGQSYKTDRRCPSCSEIHSEANLLLAVTRVSAILTTCGVDAIQNTSHWALELLFWQVKIHEQELWNITEGELKLVQTITSSKKVRKPTTYGNDVGFICCAKRMS